MYENPKDTKHGGSVKKEKREYKIRQDENKRRGKRRKMREKGGGSQKTKKKEEWEGWIQGYRGVWVLRRAGPHTNKVRSTWMFCSFSSSKTTQTTPFIERTTQTTPLIEARSEKMRAFQTQLLHYFAKSNNKSNHQHMYIYVYIYL